MKVRNKSAVFICFFLLLSMQLDTAGYGAGVVTEAGRTLEGSIETFNALWHEQEGDTPGALKILLEDPGLELVDCKTRGFTLEDGTLAECGADDGTSWDLQLTDVLLFDQASGGYVYFGAWDWKSNYAAMETAETWDYLEFCIGNSEAALARDYVVTGYSEDGARIIYYDTAAQTAEGSIQKSTDLLSGVTFWYDDTDVDHGLFCVPLNRFADASVTQLWMTMGHTEATSKRDFQITRKGLFDYRFFIRWDTDVVESNVRSAGVYI